MDSGFSHLLNHVAQAQGRPWTQDTGSRVGCPIRKSLDQSSFAAPQGLSQRTTSFIASQRQGIHRMLLRHLITLMIDVRRARIRGSGRPTLIRKTIAARTFRLELLLAEHTRSRTRSRPRWSSGLGAPTFGYVPSSRFQTPARNLRCRRIAFDPDGRALLGRGRDDRSGGARRDRTDDLMLAKHALSQLSYGPI